MIRVKWFFFSVLSLVVVAYLFFNKHAIRTGRYFYDNKEWKILSLSKAVVKTQMRSAKKTCREWQYRSHHKLRWGKSLQQLWSNLLTPIILVSFREHRTKIIQWPAPTHLAYYIKDTSIGSLFSERHVLENNDQWRGPPRCPRNCWLSGQRSVSPQSNTKP